MDTETVLKNSLPFMALLFTWAAMFGVLRTRRRRSEAQRDVQIALLNKFSTGEEMTKFLSTEEGRRLVDHIASPSDDDPRRRAVVLVIPACVLSAVAIGFAIFASIEQREDMLLPAIVIGGVGVGLFAGAALSMRIAKKLGMTKDR